MGVRGLILAAGLGTRLRPITNEIPKCLVEVGGEPILGWWIKHLEAINCDRVIINTHYKSEKVSHYIKQRDGMDMHIEERYEPVLLGTAGSMLKYRKFFDKSIVIVAHADNATDIDLNELIEAHKRRPKQCLLTMLTFTCSEPERCGIVETDADGIVRGFYEKVKNPPGNRANGAVYVFEEELFDIMEEEKPHLYDFSTQVLPQLIGKIYTWHTDQHFIDIGTPKSLDEARQIWGNKSKKK